MLGISGKGVKNYQVIDVFDGTDLGIISIKESIKILVNPTGIYNQKDFFKISLLFPLNIFWLHWKRANYLDYKK